MKQTIQLLLVSALAVVALSNCSGDSKKKDANGVNAQDYPNVTNQALGRWKSAEMYAYVAKDKVTMTMDCGASLTVKAQVSENTIIFLETKEDKKNDTCVLATEQNTGVYYYMAQHNGKELFVIDRRDQGKEDLAFERLP